jgi:bile acid:Na+ symporter, BASS family
MKKFYSMLLICAVIGALAAIFLSVWGLKTGQFLVDATGCCVVGSLVCLAVGGLGNSTIRPMAFTVWIFVSVSIALFFPQYFRQIGDFKMTTLITPLIQLIMFTMGTEMSLKDFESVIKTPKAVIIGLISHFTIMPLVGVSIAKGFGFPPEIAAGIVLIGSVPSGVSSNVLAFIAKANLPLSITFRR